MAAGVVTLGSLTFNAGPDSDGDRFVVGEIAGWEGAGVEQTSLERPLSDGAIVGRGRRASRAVTLVGHASSSTLTGMWRARRKLAAACDALITASGTLSVDEGDDIYTLSVRLAGSPDTRQAGPYGIEFSINLIAADPAKTPTGS